MLCTVFPYKVYKISKADVFVVGEGQRKRNIQRAFIALRYTGIHSGVQCIVFMLSFRAEYTSTSFIHLFYSICRLQVEFRLL